uniref:Zymogen granule membrane protein 16-like n=1 Tax=Gadus morhua TaxID=8049 RepID=A0A8C5CXD1_GADMO
MLSFLFFAAAWVACLAKSNQYYSYSPALGSGSGTPFSSKEEGSITGVKVWENPNSHITGIQLRHGTKWGHLNGRVTTSEERLDLFVGEAIIQVSGKFNPKDRICQLIFETSMGRALIAGQPIQVLFHLFIFLFILIFILYFYLVIDLYVFLCCCRYPLTFTPSRWRRSFGC